MLRNTLLSWLRKLGLMQEFDRLYYSVTKARFYIKNQKFKKENPSVKFPSPYMLFESYRMDYISYFNDGIDTAFWVKEHLSVYISLGGKNILDWGCGPARVIQHLPALLPHSKMYGSDYNAETIEWCKENISGVEFKTNGLVPPLSYPDDFFDAVYALSVFTHLSEKNHYEWMDELYRVLKIGGMLLLTTQGKVFFCKLTEREKNRFLKGDLIVRARAKEGHRSFSAFQSEAFMNSIFDNQWKVLKFVPGRMQRWGPEQDTWIVQKIKE